MGIRNETIESVEEDPGIYENKKYIKKANYCIVLNVFDRSVVFILKKLTVCIILTFVYCLPLSDGFVQNLVKRQQISLRIPLNKD